MIHRVGRRAAFRAALLLGCAFPALAHAIPVTSRYSDANGVSQDPPPPVHTTVDPTGVDLSSGQLSLAETQVSIGDPAQGGLSWVYYAGLAEDNFYGAVNLTGPSTYTVSVGGKSLKFSTDGSNPKNNAQSTKLWSDQGEGATLDLGASLFTLTMRDGSIAVFDSRFQSNSPSKGLARIISLTDPYGVAQSYAYGQYTTASSTNAYRLQGVKNNLGYAIAYTYQTSNHSPTDGVLTQVKGINLAIDYCADDFSSCTTTTSWPTASISGTSITDARGLTTTYPVPIANGTAVLTRPGGVTQTFAFDANLRVTSITNNAGKIWQYGYVGVTGPADGIPGHYQTTNLRTVVYDPLNNNHNVLTSGVFGTILTDTNGVGKTTSYTYDGFGRPLTVTTQTGIKTLYQYDPDGRGNIIETDVTASGTSGKVIRTYASYDSTCANFIKCNQPNSTVDGNGKTTTYGFTAQGFLNGVIGPASSGTGAANLKTHQIVEYNQYFARYKNGSGTLGAGPLIWRKSYTSVCATAETCLGQADASETSVGYGDPNAANNLAVRSVTARSGNSAVSSTTNVSYDGYGHLYSVQNGRNYTTRYVYDGANRLFGTIGPDPDGSGGLKYRAARNNYDGYGRIVSVDQGTAASQSDADFHNMAVIAERTFGFDALGRQSQTTLVVGAIKSVTQYGYDDADRLVYTAERMNPDTFLSLPAASQLAKIGQYGADRITQTGYDAANRATSVITGLGTPSQKTESTAYTDDGLVDTRTDGKGNATKFIYDPFDRLQQVQFPTVGAGGTPNVNDKIVYAYDDAGNVTGITQRDGSTATFTYDDASRLTLRSGTATPGQTNKAADVALTYDNLGRVKTAASGGQSLTFGYDALSRLTSEQGPIGTVYAQYDANGNLTQLKWPDQAIANYQYDATDALIQVSDPYTRLAYYTYDDLGRRAAVYHANSANNVWTSCAGYGYGGDLRINALSLYAGCNGTVTQGWGYETNPAGQVIKQSSSNASYDFIGAAAGNRGYSVDALNRYTQSGGAALAYDGRGNLSNDSRLGYGFDTLNKLTSASNGAVLSYDAADRLRAVTAGSAVTRFVSFGGQIVAEYDGSGNVLDRYVPGAAVDELAGWYEAPGAGGYANRRYSLTDRQGSTAAVLNDAGSVLKVNTYDDFGGPASTNAGRFGYNGAPFLKEIDLYHMRARAYSYRLGRFMQTDPIGYGDGLNFYNYTHGDPVNGWDPSGLIFALQCTVSTYSDGVPGDAPGTSASCYYEYIPDPPLPGGRDFSDFSRDVRIARGFGGKTGNLPPDKACSSAGDNLGSTVLDRAGDAHGAAYGAGQAVAKQAGNASGAAAIGKAAIPGALLFSAGSELVGGLKDHANGMTAVRAGSIHGTGFLGGVLTGAFVGELTEPLFGGIPGAILGGILGSKGGEKMGGDIAAGLGHCH